MSLNIKNIKIIENTNENLDITQLPEAERHILFQQLSEDIPSMPSLYFEYWSDMYDHYIKDTIFLIKPTIDELILRKLFELDFNIYPIINNFGINIKETGYNISLNVLQTCFTLDGRKYINPPGNNITILGIKIRDKCISKTIFDLLSGFYNFSKIIQSCQLITFKHNFGSQIYMFNLKNDFLFINRLYDFLINIKKYAYSSDSIYYIIPQLYKKYDTYKPHPLVFENITPIKPIDASHPDNQFVKSLELIENSQFTQNTLLSDLYSFNLFDIYYIAKIKGKDDSDVTHFLDYKHRSKAINQFNLQLHQKQMNELYLVNLFKKAIETHLGSIKYDELRPKLDKIKQVNEVLNLLNDKEKKIINLEVERRQKYLNAVINNKCPHVNLYKKLRRKYSEQTLLELGLFFTKSKPDEIVKCNNCGFDIICPHFIDLVKNYTKTYQILKEKLSKYIDIIKGTSSSGYYCKICGEFLSYTDRYESVSNFPDSSYGKDSSDTLKDLIKTEIYLLIRKIKIPSLLNPNILLNYTINAIYDYIYELEKKFLKSKVMLSEDIKNQLKLNITIYATAYLFIFIQSNKDDKNSISFRGINPKANATEQIKFAIILIKESKNIIISKMHNISIEYIKNKFREAYMQLIDKGEQKIEYSNQTYNSLTSILLDPLYNYFVYINSLDMEKNLTFAQVIGVQPSDITTLTDFYSKVRLPKDGGKWDTSHFYKLPKFSFFKPISSQILLAKQAANGYIIESFNAFYYPIKYNLLNSNLFIDTEFTSEYDKYYIYSNRIITAEFNLLQYYRIYSGKLFYKLEGDLNYNFKYVPITFGALYDENGYKHNLNIAITNDGEYTIKQIAEIGPYFDKTILGYRCSICGVKEADFHTFSEEIIMNSITLNQDIINLFTIFEIKCPINNIHEWADDICKKCKLSIDLRKRVLSSHNLYDGQTIYQPIKLYYDTYQEVAKETRKDDTNYIIDAPLYAKIPQKTIPDPDWFFNFNIILELANIIGNAPYIPKIIMSIGGTENLNYKLIKNGSIVPLEPNEVNSTRIYNIKSYIYIIISKWNLLRNSWNNIMPPEWINKLIESSGIKPHEMSVLNELPSLYNEFEEKLSWFLANKTSDKCINFCLQNLAEKILFVKSMKSPKTQKLRDNFALYIITSILRDEELMSTFDKNKLNPNSFNSTRKEITEDEYNENYDEDLNIETEDNFAEDKEQMGDDFGDTNELFSTENFDIDIEKTDDDDGEFGDNDINVEGYALD